LTDQDSLRRAARDAAAGNVPAAKTIRQNRRFNGGAWPGRLAAVRHKFYVITTFQLTDHGSLIALCKP